MNKLIAVLLFFLWCHLALQATTGGDLAMLLALTVMIVIVETNGEKERGR